VSLPATIVDAARALRDRRVSSAELVAAAQERADRLDPLLGVFVTRFDEQAQAAAATADRELAAGVDRGPLHGIPLGIKDNIATVEGPTTGNSVVRMPVWLEPRDAHVVGRLRAAGAVVVGKVATMEFALGIPDPAKPFPVPRNPWNRAHWTGGSSSGSASGVAAGLFLGALGTDTGGSVRAPAANCGVSGLRQTFGRVSRTGVIPCGLTLDVVGPLARSAADLAALLQAMAGPDPEDRATVATPVPDWPGALDGSLRGVRIGVERRNHLDDDAVEPEVAPLFEEAVEQLQGLGATTTEVELPYWRELIAATRVTLCAESLAYHRNTLREQWDAYGAEARLALASALFLTGDDYVLAQQLRRVGRRSVARLFERIDALVCPTTATVAPRADGLDLGDLRRTEFTSYWSSAGCPIVSVPMGFGRHGLPHGLQIAARIDDEATVLRVADAFQRVTDWHLRRPPDD
jgi:aspartyl-tRNA(Asn)/glutamyl-tRNA(Gln) amidotransferase subunit A